MLSFLFMLFFAGNTLAEVYKWVDQDGVHYGDKPPISDAKAVDLPELSGYKPRQLPDKKPAEVIEVKPDAQAFQGYDRLKISSPLNDATVRANDGVVQVTLTLEPILQDGHVLTLMLDGVPVAPVGGSSSRVLTGVARGAHNLVAVVSDADGKQLIRSVSVRFFLHRASVFDRPAPKDSAEGSSETPTDGDSTDTPSPLRPAARAPQAPRAPIGPSYAPKHNP